MKRRFLMIDTKFVPENPNFGLKAFVSNGWVLIRSLAIFYRKHTHTQQQKIQI